MLKSRIVDYPNLWGYLRDLYQQPGVADTVRIENIKRHYYCSPEIDFTEPQSRGALA